MPSRSKAQYRFMKAVEKGDVKAPGLSKAEAKEFTDSTSSKRFSKLKEEMSKKRK